MDEKRQLRSLNLPAMSRYRPTRLAVFALLGIAALYALFVGHASPLKFYESATGLRSSAASQSAGGYKVPLEAHIISKCPDTRDALRKLVLPVMQKVHDKVDFTLSYIGKPAANGGIECKHGPRECLGNIIELCARELYPDPKINLGFVMCLTKDYMSIPDRSLVEDCALEHAIDIEVLNECATRDDGAHGLELLRNSVDRSADVRDSHLQNYSQTPPSAARSA